MSINSQVYKSGGGGVSPLPPQKSGIMSLEPLSAFDSPSLTETATCRTTVEGAQTITDSVTVTAV